MAVSQTISLRPGLVASARANRGLDPALVSPKGVIAAPPGLGATGGKWLFHGGRRTLVDRYNRLRTGGKSSGYSALKWSPTGVQFPETANHMGFGTSITDAAELTVILVFLRPPQGSDAGIGNRMLVGTMTAVLAELGFAIYHTSTGLKIQTRGITAGAANVRTVDLSVFPLGSPVYVGYAHSVSGGRREVFVGNGSSAPITFSDAGTPTPSTREIAIQERYYSSGWCRDWTANALTVNPNLAFTQAQFSAQYPIDKTEIAGETGLVLN